MAVDFAAYVFDGTYTAEDALRQVRAAEELRYVWVDDVAVIKRHHSGRVSIHSTWAQDTGGTGAGAALGSMTGALIGAMAGPGGALAGLFAGGATGAMFGLAIEDAVADPSLDVLADSLTEGSSALVLWGEETKPFIEEFEKYNGKLIKTKISDEVAERVRRAAWRR